MRFQNTYKRLIPERAFIGAKLYAQADRSDPFTYNRAMSHVMNGTAGLDLNGNDAYYTAEMFQEERKLSDGRTFSDGSNRYIVTNYRNVRRP